MKNALKKQTKILFFRRKNDYYILFKQFNYVKQLENNKYYL